MTGSKLKGSVLLKFLKGLKNESIVSRKELTDSIAEEDIAEGIADDSIAATDDNIAEDEPETAEVKKEPIDPSVIVKT